MTEGQPGNSNTGGQSFEPAPGAPNPDELRKAMKAFKKRLKLSRLDDESRLGHGPMSGGGRSGIVSIQPPNQFPQAVWDELVRQGRLRYVGHGLYELGGEIGRD